MWEFKIIDLLFILSVFWYLYTKQAQKLMQKHPLLQTSLFDISRSKADAFYI